MAFPELEDIMERVGDALLYDLRGGKRAGSPANDGLSSPLSASPLADQVERYTVDPTIAGEIYLSQRKHGLSVGYSFAQQSRTEPQGAVGNALSHALFIEVSILRVIDGLRSFVEQSVGPDLDQMTDHVGAALQSGRRDAPDFGAGVQTFTLEDVVRLEGGIGADAGAWTGRTLTFRVTRNMRGQQ